MKIIPFEIHITGEESIIEELNNLSIKNITVELLNKNLSVLRTEYMSSFIVKMEYSEIHKFVQELVSKLNSNIFRVKIECPPIEYLYPMSIYMESHFLPKENSNFPISRNKRSQKLMCTDREYSKDKYLDFFEQVGRRR